MSIDDLLQFGDGQDVWRNLTPHELNMAETLSIFVGSYCTYQWNYLITIRRNLSLWWTLFFEMLFDADSLDVLGFHTTCGASVYEHNAPADGDCKLVALLKKLRAIPIGKTNVPFVKISWTVTWFLLWCLKVVHDMLLMCLLDPGLQEDL